MEPHDSPGNDDPAVEATPRKPYEKPHIEVYGDLAQISRALAGSQGPDGNGHPNKHFTR